MESIDWSNLSFGYMPTDYNVRCIYKDGKWGDITVTSSQTFEIHMAATCLHYGQEAFEGMKAFRGKDGKIRIFRMDENAARLQSSCRGIMMPELPTEKFNEAILTVVKKNERFVPPYESGASLYIRPLLIGTSAQVGVKPAKEYLFIVFVSPVGPYFKEGFKPTPMAILRQYDRAAPLGTGRYKVGGNYAASLVAGEKAHELGYSAVLYLDAKEKKYIDECGPANFFGIRGNSYITPKSTSILPSITNKSLMQLAEDMIKYVINHVLTTCPDEIEFFNNFVDNGLKERLNKLVNSHFERMSYTKAIELLTPHNDKFEFPVHWGSDIATEHERFLTEQIVGGPVFVTDYPKEIKSFYMRMNDDGKTVAATDMLVPGVGELIGGSQREERLDVLTARMKELGLREEDYWWYLELRKYGGTKHAGFGLGFERLVMYLTGVQNIRDVIPFPRTVGTCNF